MAGVQPGHKRCREGGLFQQRKGIVSMKTVNANRSEDRHENRDRS